MVGGIMQNLKRYFLTFNFQLQFMAKKDSNTFFSDWLEKLQQESWQLELLISGLALFGIYESQDLLIELKMYANSNSEGLARVTQSFFIGIFAIGWKIFFINLLIHVILRGLWIGAIGLRYVSQDIDYDALKYSEYFTESLRRRVGGFDDFIEKLEKICSVLFAYTFLLFLLFFSFAFFIFQIIVISDIINNAQNFNAIPLSLAVALYLFIGFIVFIDFITLGLFKKVNDRTINKIYNAIFTFYGWTTLTFLYRPLLYNFLDNKYTRRLFYLSIPYILVIMFASNMFSNNNFAFYPPAINAQQFGNTINRMNYEDLRNEYLTEVESSVSKRRQVIPSIIINKYQNDEDYLSIFLKMDASDYKLIQKNSDIEPYWKPGFNFTLFNSVKNEDSYFTNNKALMEVKYDSLRSIRRDLKKNLRKTKDSILQKKYEAEINSINDDISKRRDISKELGNVFEEQKQNKIIQSFMDLIELEVNDLDIKPNLDCYFFRHHNNDEKGILCLYPMDSLSLGKHKIYFEKEKSTRRTDRNNNIKIKIPFYKVKNKY
jgi:hypothetical protein